MSDKVAETAGTDAKADKTDKAEKHLYMMQFEGTAGAKTGLRMGARHMIMVFIVASEPKFAVAKGHKGLEVTGWSGLEMKKIGDITGKKRFEDKAMDASARKAMEKGASFLIFKNEIKGQA
ncbi:hypothetical protein [Celeribacter neptunius]|uniref:Uncharacterized protein n=1 Tax=Celeribacter neptunius TaxID=588602 RepID=A0A1I3KI29_9RHOB|nr:hypothetical protein [Celeribacter neptunius]SFI72181.1 hypothetical protein SAMN04487991_0700 [Celeribacter neptunius]